MKTSLSFLLAAKRCAMADLQQLAATSTLVRNTAALIHALQRERGLSNLYAASRGQQSHADRLQQIEQTDASASGLRANFDRLDTAPMRHGERLFSRIAYTLHGLQALGRLREEVSTLKLAPAELSQGYARLISSLLAVVFEAADMASDPALSKQLVALFHFMQGKEFAGQERAAGSAMWLAGKHNGEAQPHLLHLIESQERCLKVFAAFATPEALQLWQRGRSVQTDAELERLRRMLCSTRPGDALDHEKSRIWFDCCSRRMDEMRLVEDPLTQLLIEHSQRRLALIGAEIQAIEALQARVAGADPDSDAADTAELFGATAGAKSATSATVDPMGPALEKSVLELVQEQTSRLQAMAAELDTVRASLSERKSIERAKGLLMAHQHLSEEAAHKALRDLAMQQNKRMVEVAEAVLSMAALLTPKG